MIRSLQRGVTLLEMMVVVAIGALIMMALNSLVGMGLRAQSVGKDLNDAAYQGQFAMERMAASARTVASKPVATPPANTTGDWFAPKMYCRNGANQLIETTVADAACAGTTVIATNVTAFSASIPAGVGPVDRPLVSLTLTITGTNTKQVASLTTTVRLGGATL